MKHTLKVNTHHAYLNTDIVFISEQSDVELVDNLTGLHYTFDKVLSMKLCAGIHVFNVMNEEQQVTIEIEDAIKLGGGNIKKTFVFDESPWAFMTTGDRLYIMNTETNQENVEYNISPDEIRVLGKYHCVPNECFLFMTKDDCSIYNVLTGKFIFHFTNYIYGNNHLVIYCHEESVVVYDYRTTKEIVRFKGQYSLENKFYFLKENALYCLDLISSDIRKISQVGIIDESSILVNNYLLNYSKCRNSSNLYYCFFLGNGEDNIIKFSIKLPFYISSIYGVDTNEYLLSKNEIEDFRSENKDLVARYPNLNCICQGLDIKQIELINKDEKESFYVYGTILTFPYIYMSCDVLFKCSINETINMRDAIYNISFPEDKGIVEQKENKYQAIHDGILLGTSETGNKCLLRKRNKIFFKNLNLTEEKQVLINSFDSSVYTDANFISNGDFIMFKDINNEVQTLDLYNLSIEKFEIQNLTVSRLNGINGYKPLLDFEELDSRIPIWRDPITLQRVLPEELSNYEFRSPDGQYVAKTQFKTVLYNRLTDKNITDDEYQELCKKYNWYSSVTDTEKERKIKERKDLVQLVGKDLVTQKLENHYAKMLEYDKDLTEEQFSKSLNRLVDSDLEDYINKRDKFTALFVDFNNYVIYNKSSNPEDDKLLYIGRNVWFLNYVSFSFDSRYLAFGAKLNNDEFRTNQEGVFAIYDLTNENIVYRSEADDNLHAVWMTMFSKTGDVAYYDSHPNTYIRTTDSDYLNVHEIKGKSLLCFSPSGRYIALSNQKYIDHQHHPSSICGHQPSGNIFIYSLDDTTNCLSQYNDLSESIQGVSLKRAGNVASVAFSSDERRLLAVGDDGVIVIRNLYLEYENSQEVVPPIMGDYSYPEVRPDERRNFIDLYFISSYDGIISDLYEYWCSMDEKWIDDCIYSVDGKILKRCPKIDLLTLIVEEGCETILKDAFLNLYAQGEGYENRLKRIYLPTTITDLDNHVFDNCFNLEEIYVPINMKEKFCNIILYYTDMIREYTNVPEKYLHNKDYTYL